MSLPSGWTLATLGDLANYINGRGFKKSEWKTEGTPIIRIQNLNDENAAFNYVEEDFEEKYRVKNDDLLVAWSASLGAYIWNRGDAWLNQHIFRVEPFSIVNKQFLYYAISESINELYRKAHGMGMVHVTKGTFEAHEIPLPPLNEQKRIADKLDRLVAQVDSVNKRVNNSPTFIKRFRQSVLAAAISGKLTEEWREEHNVNFEWDEVTINDVAEVATGKTPLKSETSYYEGGEIPWLTSSVTGRPFVRKTETYVTQKAIDECTLKIFEPGTLLVAMYGEGKTRGQVTELTFPAAINQACAALIIDKEKVEKAYLKIRLQENYAEIRKLAEGGNQPNLNLSKVRSITVPLPTRDEQKEIVSRVESFFTVADALESKIDVAKKRVDKLNQSLLAKAFRGELVPQDPNDEPAEKLLERIKAEQEKEQPKKRAKRVKKASDSTKDLLKILEKEDGAISAKKLYSLSAYGDDFDDIEKFFAQIQQLQTEKKIDVERRDDEDWISFCVEGNV
ncbi:restriction endonuclease subunit S [Sulfurimonas sp. HSL1-6]|uniref:restriction endonuclease subunit S n=1 Tax=Thiomicrolovo immobilis TaxID=3131935 RepID=UPI0031F87584